MKQEDEDKELKDFVISGMIFLFSLLAFLVMVVLMRAYVYN